MEIIIDIEESTPLFTQLIEQIKNAVKKGQIKAGDSLPSIRQLANDLEINSKTVAKAYQLLERDSIIQSKGYRGTFVHPEAKKNCSIDLTEWINVKLSTVIEELRAAEITDSEIRIAFANAINNRNN